MQFLMLSSSSSFYSHFSSHFILIQSMCGAVKLQWQVLGSHAQSLHVHELYVSRHYLLKRLLCFVISLHSSPVYFIHKSQNKSYKTLCGGNFNFTWKIPRDSLDQIHGAKPLSQAIPLQHYLPSYGPNSFPHSLNKQMFARIIQLCFNMRHQNVVNCNKTK